MITALPKSLVIPAVSMLLLAARALGAVADAPSNLELISAMPPGTESVMVLRMEPLRSERSIFRSAVAASPVGPTSAPASRSAEEPGQPMSSVYDDLRAAGPVVVVTGGSAFEAPRSSGPESDPNATGIGTGNFLEREIWIVSESTKSARQHLEASGKASNISVAGRSAYGIEVDYVYGGPENVKPTHETRFIAFEAERTAVIAEKQEKLAHMLDSLAKHRQKIPDQWAQAVNGLNIEAPVVILRKYDPTNTRDFYSPVNPQRSRDAGIDSLGLCLNSVEAHAYTARVVAKNPDTAMVAIHSGLMPEDEYAWKPIRDKDGAIGTLEYSSKVMDQGGGIAWLQWAVLFGMNIVI